MCHYSRPLNDTFIVGCCKDYDLCNRDLKPILHVHNNTGKLCLAAGSSCLLIPLRPCSSIGTLSSSLFETKSASFLPGFGFSLGVSCFVCFSLLGFMAFYFGY